MSKNKLGIPCFDIDIKLKNKKEARKYAKRLIEKIRYICNKKKCSNSDSILKKAIKDKLSSEKVNIDL